MDLKQKTLSSGGNFLNKRIVTDQDELNSDFNRTDMFYGGSGISTNTLTKGHRRRTSIVTIKRIKPMSGFDNDKQEFSKTSSFVRSNLNNSEIAPTRTTELKKLKIKSDSFQSNFR